MPIVTELPPHRAAARRIEFRTKGRQHMLS
jgi:hypothetical protein